MPSKAGLIFPQALCKFGTLKTAELQLQSVGNKLYSLSSLVQGSPSHRLVGNVVSFSMPPARPDSALCVSGSFCFCVSPNSPAFSKLGLCGLRSVLDMEVSPGCSLALKTSGTLRGGQVRHAGSGGRAGREAERNPLDAHCGPGLSQSAREGAHAWCKE